MGAVVNVRGITDKKSFATKKAKCRRKKGAGTEGRTEVCKGN